MAEQQCCALFFGEVSQGSVQGGLQLAAADGRVLIGLAAGVIRGHRFALTWGDFGPDGRRVVTGSIDTTARVWNLETPSHDSLPLSGHGGPLWSVAFSPDGTRWATASQDGTVRVGSADGESPVRVLRGHTGAIRSVTFSPDGRYVVSGGFDGTARIWAWQPQDLITFACEYLPRNLTHAEWNQYIGDALPYQAVCPNLPIEP